MTHEEKVQEVLDFINKNDLGGWFLEQCAEHGGEEAAKKLMIMIEESYMDLNF